jgi:hypothetical protein
MTIPKNISDTASLYFNLATTNRAEEALDQFCSLICNGYLPELSYGEDNKANGIILNKIEPIHTTTEALKSLIEKSDSAVTVQ